MDGVNASIMASFFQAPNSAGEDWSVYEYIPKTRSPMWQQDGLKGWGLYVEEGVSQRIRLLCVVVSLTVAYLSVIWGLVQAKETLGIIIVLLRRRL